jgi:predicted transcriptional regulator
MDADELRRELDQPKIDVISKIAKEIYKQPKQPDEFTAMEVSDQTGLEYKTVVYRLKKLEKDGTLTSRKPANKRLYRYVDKEET